MNFRRTSRIILAAILFLTLPSYAAVVSRHPEENTQHTYWYFAWDFGQCEFKVHPTLGTLNEGLQAQQDNPDHIIMWVRRHELPEVFNLIDANSPLYKAHDRVGRATVLQESTNFSSSCVYAPTRTLRSSSDHNEDEIPLILYSSRQGYEKPFIFQQDSIACLNNPPVSGDPSKLQYEFYQSRSRGFPVSFQYWPSGSSSAPVPGKPDLGIVMITAALDSANEASLELTSDSVYLRMSSNELKALRALLLYHGVEKEKLQERWLTEPAPETLRTRGARQRSLRLWDYLLRDTSLKTGKHYVDTVSPEKRLDQLYALEVPSGSWTKYRQMVDGSANGIMQSGRISTLSVPLCLPYDESNLTFVYQRSERDKQDYAFIYRPLPLSAWKCATLMGTALATGLLAWHKLSRR